MKKKRINSRSKGAAAERELAHLFTDHGFPARRGQQFAGGPESPDVVVESMPWLHVESKRVEKGNPYVWMAQAKRDSGDAQTPLVAHRKNGEEWLAILPLDALLRILKVLEERR